MNANPMQQPRKPYRLMPLFFALVTSLFSGFLFLTFGRLHGMWDMFERWYPFFFANLFGVVETGLSNVQALLWAMLDGAVLGGVIGWLFRRLLLRRPLHEQR